MTETAELVKQDEPISPMALIQIAVSQGAAVETIERLTKLMREERDYQNASDFDDALNRCQKKLGFVAQDMEREDGRGKYASYPALNRAIRPVYSSEGFAVSFSEAEGTTAELVVMVGLLSRCGIQRPYRKVLPIDTKGPRGGDVMTKTDASCAASSRAKRYILKAMFNLAEGEDENDGKSEDVEPGGSMPDENFVEHRDWIRACENSADLQKQFDLAIQSAKAANDKKAIREFTQEMVAKIMTWIAGAVNVETAHVVGQRGYVMAQSAGDQAAGKKIVAAKDARKRALNASR